MVCKESNDLASSLLVTNPEYAKELNQFAENIKKYDDAIELSSGTEKRIAQSQKYNEEAKLDSFVKARLVDSNAVYKASLLDLYGRSGDFEQAVKLVGLLDDLPPALASENLAALNGLIISIGNPETVINNASNLFMKRLAHDTVYAEKFGIGMFGKRLGDVKYTSKENFQKLIEGIVKGQTTEELLEKYAKKDEMLAKVFAKTDNPTKAMNDYIIGRILVDGQFQFGELKGLSLEARYADAKMSDSDFKFYVNWINNIDTLKFAGFVNMSRLMGNKELFEVYSKRITELMGEGDTDTIAFMSAWRSLGDVANVNAITDSIIEKTTGYKLLAAGMPSNQESIDSLYSYLDKYAKGKKVNVKIGEKTLGEGDIEQVLDLLGVSKVIDSKVNLSGIVDRIAESRKEVGTILRKRKNELMKDFFNLVGVTEDNKKAAKVMKEKLKAALTSDWVNVEVELNRIVDDYNAREPLDQLSNKGQATLLDTFSNQRFNSEDAFYIDTDLKIDKSNRSASAFSELSEADFRSGALKIASDIEKGSLDQAVASGKKYVIVKNFNQLSANDIQRLGKKKIVWPKGKQDLGFILDGGDLYVGGRTNGIRNYIAEVAKTVRQEANITSEIDATDLYKEILDLRYGTDAQLIDDYLTQTYPSLSYFERIKKLDLVTNINSGIIQDVVDEDNVIQDILDLPVETLADEVTTYTGLPKIDIPSMNPEQELEFKKAWYNWKYSGSLKDKVESLNDVVTMLGHNETLADDYTHAAQIANELNRQGFDLPFENPVAIITGEKYKQFVQDFIAKNRFQQLTFDQADVILKQAEEVTKLNPTSSRAWEFGSGRNIKYITQSTPEIDELMGSLSALKSENINILPEKEIGIFQDIFNRYYNEADKMVKAGASEKEMYQLKKKYQNVLIAYEQQYLRPKFGPYVKDEKTLFTYAYDLLKVTNEDDLILARQYGDSAVAEFTTFMNGLAKQGADVSDTFADDLRKLADDGFVVKSDGETLVRVRTDNYLQDELMNMSDDIGELSKFKNYDLKTLSEAQKVRLIKLVHTANIARSKLVTPADSILEKIFDLNAGDIFDYRRVSVEGVGDIPYRLSVTNNTDLPGLQDKLIKREIFVKISRAINNGNFGQEELVNIVRSSTDSAHVDQYVKDFAMYTKLRQIPTELSERLNSFIDEPLDLAGIEDFGDVKINTLRGTYTLREATQSTAQDMLDDLLTDGSRVSVPVEAQASEEFIKRSENYIFAAQKGLDETDELTSLLKNDMTNKFFNNAGDILKGGNPRLRQIYDTGRRLESKAQAASRVIKQRFGWRNSGKATAKQYLTEANLKNVQDQYVTYMTMSDQEFKNLDVTNLNEIGRSAYIVADYFRDLRTGLKDITTDIEVNSLIDNIWRLFPRLKDPAAIESLSSQIRNFEPFTMVEEANRARIFRFQDTNGFFQIPILGYGGFVDREGLTKFNQLFGSDLNMGQYTTLLQALNNFKFGDVVGKLTQGVNWLLKPLSTPFTRTLLSYPGSAYLLASQVTAYEVTNKFWKSFLGETDEGMDLARKTRQEFGVLVGEGNDVSEFWKHNIGDSIPSQQQLHKSVLTNARATGFRILEPVADSANNFADTAYAGTTKDLSFLDALRSNDVRRFNTAKEFKAYMANETDEILKKELIDSISVKATEAYRNATGVALNSLDKSQFRGVTGLLLALTNFRGSWGLQITKDFLDMFQTGGKLSYYLAVNGKSPQALKQAEKYLASHPKFIRFFQTLIGTAVFSTKLEKIISGKDDNREESYVKNIVESFTNLSMWMQGMNANVVTRILGNLPWGPTSGLIGGAKYGYDNAEKLGTNKIAATLGGGYIGALSAVQQSFLTQLRFLKPATKMLDAYSTGGWDSFISTMDSEMANLSTGMARYMLDVYSGNKMEDYIPQDKNPNANIFGFGTTESQDVRNELRTYEKLLKFFKDPEVLKGDPSVSDKINNSFFWSELLNFGPIGSIVRRYITSGVYDPQSGDDFERLYIGDPFIRGFVLNNELNWDSASPDDKRVIEDVLWGYSAGFGLGKSGETVTPYDIILNFNEQAKEELTYLDPDYVALGAMSPERREAIKQIWENSTNKSRDEEITWKIFLDGLNELPEDKKKYASGLYLKMYMNREYENKKKEYAAQIKVVNKGLNKENDLDSTPPITLQNKWKEEILEQVKPQLLEIDRPNIQYAVNQIMIQRNVQELRDMGVLTEEKNSYGKTVYKIPSGWTNYMDSSVRLMSMIAENKPDAYAKTQSVFNSVGRYSSPEVQTALFMRIYEFIDKRDNLEDDEKLDWKASILEANKDMLFKNEELLRANLGDKVVDQAIGYFYQYDDKLREYAQGAYAAEKTTGTSGGAGKKSSLRIPDLKIGSLKEARKQSEAWPVYKPVTNYQNSPGTAASRSPNPGPVDKFRLPPSAVSKNYFKQNSTLKDIARKITLQPTKELKGLTKKKK